VQYDRHLLDFDVDDLLQQLEPMFAADSNETVANRDIHCQTDSSWAHRRTVGVQTPLAEPLYLPEGWTIRRLIQLALAEPLRSPIQLADSVSRQLGLAVPDVHFNNMILVFEAQTETIRLVLEEVAAYQRRLQGLISQRQPVHDFQREFEVWLNGLTNRAYGNDEPLRTTPVASTTAAQSDQPSAPTRAQTARRGRRTSSTSTRQPWAAPSTSSATGTESFENSSEEERYMDELYL
jgi:hypothetical protein